MSVKTVRELIQQLEVLDMDAKVYLSTDGEGNCFSAYTDDVIAEGIVDEDENPCIVIWPGYPTYVDLDFGDDDE